jgi:YHS domain-containing protein
MSKDPVCNMAVDEEKAQFVSEVAGKKAYFCSVHCKSFFDRNRGVFGY